MWSDLIWSSSTFLIDWLSSFLLKESYKPEANIVQNSIKKGRVNSLKPASLCIKAALDYRERLLVFQSELGLVVRIDAMQSW